MQSRSGQPATTEAPRGLTAETRRRASTSSAGLDKLDPPNGTHQYRGLSLSKPVEPAETRRRASTSSTHLGARAGEDALGDWPGTLGVGGHEAETGAPVEQVVDGCRTFGQHAEQQLFPRDRAVVE